MAAKTELTLAEKIDRARDGRTQSWLVSKMNKMGCPLSEVQFSRKKKGKSEFSEKEISAISEILSIKF